MHIKPFSNRHEAITRHETKVFNANVLKLWQLDVVRRRFLLGLCGKRADLIAGKGKRGKTCSRQSERAMAPEARTPMERSTEIPRSRENAHPLGLSWGPRHMPTIIGGWVFSYGRGTHVELYPQSYVAFLPTRLKGDSSLHWRWCQIGPPKAPGQFLGPYGRSV